MRDAEQPATWGSWFAEIFERISQYYFLAVEHENHFAFVAAVLGIIGGAVALYRLLLYWDRTRRKLFTAYLNDQETRILERKGLVARRLITSPKPFDSVSDFNVHADIDRALRLYDKGNLADAELALRTLHSRVAQRYEFANKQAQVARLQIAAAHLFLGSMKASQHEPSAAIEEFRKCLELSQYDFDALKYLAEQYLVLAADEPENADGHAGDALKAAKRLERLAERHAGEQQKEIRAEGLKLQGLAQTVLGARGLAKDAFQDAALAADWTDTHHELVAEINERLGESHVLLKNWKLADEAFAISATRFDKASDSDRSASVRKKRQKAASKGAPELVSANGLTRS